MCVLLALLSVYLAHLQPLAHNARMNLLSLQIYKFVFMLHAILINSLHQILVIVLIVFPLAILVLQQQHAKLALTDIIITLQILIANNV